MMNIMNDDFNKNDVHADENDDEHDDDNDD